jgi:hypothetical protein
MDLIYGYALFAATTAIAAHYELINPVMEEVLAREPEDNISLHPKLTHMVAFLLSILLAPLVLVPTLIPSAGKTFRNTLVTSLIG